MIDIAGVGENTTRTGHVETGPASSRLDTSERLLDRVRRPSDQMHPMADLLEHDEPQLVATSLLVAVHQRQHFVERAAVP